MADEPAAPPVERGDGIAVIRGSGTCRDWNGIRYKTGHGRRQRRRDASSP